MDSIVAKAGIVASNTVTANWNGAPTASAGQDQNVSVGSNVILDGSVSSDPNYDPLTYEWSQISGPAVVLNNSNQAIANFTAAISGTYEFQLTVSDGVFSDSDSVTIQTSDLNNAPTAQDQSLSIDEDTILPVTLSGTDTDGDALTFTVLAAPMHGTLSGNAPNLSYLPDPNFNGPDAFTFQANDGQLDSNVATISITVQPVNDPPEADDQSVSTNEDVSVDITLTASDVENDGLTFEIVTQPMNGSLSGTPPNVTYQPNLNYFGPDSFTFKANDSQLDSNIATINITVAPENDPPLANDQSVSTDEDISVSITLGATDFDNDPLTYTIVTQPLLGSLSGIPPQLTYQPNPNSNGQDSFTFRVNDGQADSNIATVNINVNAINDAPQAFDQSVATNENTSVAITLTGSDAENSVLTYMIVSQPAHGNLSGAPPEVTYQPNANYSGPDSFTFSVNDGQADSNIATVSITVNEVNGPPSCSQASASPNEIWPPNHKMHSISISGITDPEGDSFTVQVNQVKQDEPVNGLGDGDTSPDATIVPLQLRSERSGNGDGRVYHIFFTATDNQNHSCTGEVTVCVRHDVPSACVDEGAIYDSTQP